MLKSNTKRFVILFATAAMIFLFGRGLSDAAYGPFEDNGDGTISDAATELVWQQSDSKATWENGCQLCETLELGGFDDWRMPRVDELRTLVDYQLVNPAAIEMFYARPSYYWTDDTGPPGNPDQAWIVSFFSGTVMPLGIGESHYVRCVRGGPNWSENPSERLIPKNAEVALDPTTNLSWQRVHGGPGHNWDAAVKYCEDLDPDPDDGWRLPKIEELQTLIDYTGDGPDIFDSSTGEYWSHTLKARDASYAWTANTGNGLVDARFSIDPIDYAKTIYTRCVRGVFKITIDEPPLPELEFDGAVSVDIKPGGCPNRLNVKSRGVVPVAVLGTDDFYVTDLDPASIRLEGVSPVRSSIEDVTGPAYPVSDEATCGDAEEPDGFPDLVLKFRTRALVNILGDVNDGERRLLKLTSTLFDGTPVRGEDVVLIVKKGKKK